MPSITQRDRLLQFTSPAGQDVLLLESVWGAEPISRLFEFHAELLATTDTVIDPTEIVGAAVNISIDLSDVLGKRYISGIVAAFEQGGGDEEFNNYRAHIVPALWQLTLNSDCRVFQDKTVMEIIDDVLSPYGLSYQNSCTNTYKPLDYCTQYQETDFNFFSRLLEQHGIFYWFEHTADSHEVVFGDSRDVYPDCPLSSDVQYSPQGSGEDGSYGSGVSEISAISTMVSGKHTYWDYDFRAYGSGSRQITTQNSKSPFGNNAYERYMYPAGEQGFNKKTESQHTDPDFGTLFLDAQTTAMDATAQVFNGAADTRSFCAGHAFTMSDHPRDEWNQRYLLTEVVMHATQVPSYRSKAGSNGGYSNQFKAISADIVYKPQAITPKPLIHGPQTAVVQSPQGEEQAVDSMGRVCVRLFWDRLREDDTIDNTWVRVAQPWAGSGWGFYLWPRKGDEVLIAFIDGDPDSPVIVGSLYNSDNVPKYGLPDASTRSGIYTRSTKEGSSSNANELRFEDKMGSEQIFLNAERDMDQRVEQNHRMFVGAKDSLIVKGGQYTDVTGDQHTHVSQDRLEKIDGDYGIKIGKDLYEDIATNHAVSVGQNLAQKVGMNHSIDAGEQMYLKAGMTTVIEAGMGLCIKAGGSFITLGPEGVSIMGTMVLINSGGAALSGSAADVTPPDPPDDPDEADDGTQGGAM
jgi:type VI secretion system secreted protein VgrG